MAGLEAGLSRTEFAVELEDRQTEQIFTTIYEDFEILGVRPVRLIQGGKTLDVISTENTGAHRDRPFIVFQVDSFDDSGYGIYKVRSEKDTQAAAQKEIIFLQRIAPLLNQEMPDSLREKINLPGLKTAREEGDFPFCLEEYFDGQITGELQRVDPEVLDEEDIDSLVDFIRFFHEQLDLETIQQLAPEIPIQDRSPYTSYSYSLPRREEIIRANLGGPYYETLEQLLQEREGFIKNTELTFVAGDINSANIIKMPNGKLGLFDWERISTSRAPASDYGFLFATLWSRPDLQKRFLDRSIEVNSDNPDFAEHLRLDFVFARGAVVLWDWLNELEDENLAENSNRKQLTQEAVGTITQMLKDAIDQKGIWEENNE